MSDIILEMVIEKLLDLHDEIHELEEMKYHILLDNLHLVGSTLRILTQGWVIAPSITCQSPYRGREKLNINFF